MFCENIEKKKHRAEFKVRYDWINFDFSFSSLVSADSRVADKVFSNE